MFAEVNILKELDHPNIVKLYELYQDSKNYYLVTEYYLNQTLGIWKVESYFKKYQISNLSLRKWLLIS